MRTYLDCIPCFLKQSLEIARLSGLDEHAQKHILDTVAAEIPTISLDTSPPEIAKMITQLVQRKTGALDAYKDIKHKSNQRALNLYPRLKDKVNSSKDRLLTAIELAIAGNIIDYAAKNTMNIEEEIKKLFTDEFLHLKKSVFDYSHFQTDLKKSKKILYLADNAGEILFDRVLIEEFPRDKEVIFAVRDKPVINDATLDDAYTCGLDQCANVISSGVDAPGTLLKFCSKEFRQIFKNADLIISKGQGNYEALSQESGPIYFLFRVKCPVIAQHSGCALGDFVLAKNTDQ